MTRCHWAGVAFMMLTSLAWGQATGEADAPLGPQSGDVAWSLRNHGLTWETPQLTLHLDPWFTVRHLTGTPPTTSEAAVSPWDNLRGAHFEAVLDGVWHVDGSLEEMQGWAGAWDAATMTEPTALPGWGRVKLTSGGRVDVARARVTSRYSRVSTQGDSLSFTTAYAPMQWGDLPSALTFSDEAASFPRASVTWVRTNGLTAQTTAARWTGTERGPDGGSTENLFRQTDAGWINVGWQNPTRGALGWLGGLLRERPWTGELAADSVGQFAWRGWMSLSSSWHTASKHLQVSGEWTSHQGWGVATSWRPNSAWSFTLGTIRLPALDDGRIALHNAGTPVSAVLRPTGTLDALWRTELHGHWKTSRWTCGGRAATVGTFCVAEAWVAFALQREWPLHLSLGAEIWQGATHPTLPTEGARLRVGVAHRMGMTPGSTTFGTP